MSKSPHKAKLTMGETLDAEGLNHHERLARLERAVRGDGGLWDQGERLKDRVEVLESAVRRLQIPWYLRWLSGLRRNG